MDNIVPLLKWAAANPEKVPPEDSGIPAKVLLVKYFSKKIFARIFQLIHEKDKAK